MATTERFTSMADVRMQRDVLRARRAAHGNGIRSHWNTLGEGEFRSGVVNGAFRSIWSAWRPLDTLRTVAGQPGDLTGTILGLALGSRARTPWGRALVWAAGAAMPFVVDRLRENERVQHFLVEFQRSWDRIRERVRTPREDRDQL